MVLAIALARVPSMDCVLDCMRALMILLGTAPATDRKEESRAALYTGFCEGSRGGSDVAI